VSIYLSSPGNAIANLSNWMNQALSGKFVDSNPNSGDGINTSLLQANSWADFSLLNSNQKNATLASCSISQDFYALNVAGCPGGYTTFNGTNPL